MLATSVAVAQFFVVRTPGNKSYHTTGVFLIAAALLLPPALLALIPLIQHIPEWLRSRGTWYVQIDEHLRVHDRDDVGVGGGAPHPAARTALIASRRRPLRARGHRGRDRPRRAQLGADRAHDPPGQRSSDAPALLVPDALDGVRLRSPRRHPRRVLDRQPVARPVRDRAAAADPPVALGAAAAGGGARRSEDRALQRALLRVGARGGARARAALRAAAVADHGRPRPAARDQQHLRPSRRRRRPEGHRRGLPRRAAPLRRSRPLRRRGVLDPAPGDAARAGDGDRRADPPRGRRASCSRSRRRASRSAPPSRSASPASRRTRRTRTSSSTRPTSPSTARSSRAATASSAPAPSRC